MRIRLSRSAKALSCAVAAYTSLVSLAGSAPVVRRLTPPSNLFSTGDPNPPIISRFLSEQRFDLQVSVTPDPGRAITGVFFEVDGTPVPGPVALTPATAAGVPAGTIVATRRAFSEKKGGVHLLSVTVVQDDTQETSAEGNFEIVDTDKGGKRTKNLIIAIGDGMGIAHRTAARIMKEGVRNGKSNGLLAMDRMPYTGIVTTHSLNSIVTDSSPGAACYATGNKSNNNQQGVFPDDTNDNFDNPRVELISEYMRRKLAPPRGASSDRIGGTALGIVTTSDVFDATPGSFASHTQNRGAGTGIVDQFFDDRELTGLKVLLGGGRKWFLPNVMPGSARAAANDYVLPAELASAWGAAPGAIDPARNLLQDFETAGYSYVADATELASIAPATDRLLGLFALSNMNIALDKIGKRRGSSTVVDDYGFPDQPMLDEMVGAALQVLNRNDDGFVLMFEAASIDKQAHNMDTERWILDTIEFDRAIEVARDFASEDRETLLVVTADHECAGVNIIGGSRVTNADLTVRAGSGGGAAQLRTSVVGTYEAAGFPSYTLHADGYPVTTDIDRRMLIGYAANGDRFEDWQTNARPLRDSQQPFNGMPPLNTYPSGPMNRDTAGNFLVTGQIADSSAAHTGSDIPVSAFGLGAYRFTGVMDNTDVFFKMLDAAIGGSKKPAKWELE